MNDSHSDALVFFGATGDLAYRLLLKTADMMRDPELSGFVTNPQVNYWLGPDCHAGKTFLDFSLKELAGRMLRW